VDELAAHQPDLVKILVEDHFDAVPKIPIRLSSAIIQEAHKHGLKVVKAPAAAPAQVAEAPKAVPAKAPARVKKGGLTEAGRKKLSIALKKRWATKKKVAKNLPQPLRRS
jgi:hypothetical protein